MLELVVCTAYCTTTAYHTVLQSYIRYVQSEYSGTASGSKSCVAAKARDEEPCSGVDGSRQWGDGKLGKSKQNEQVDFLAYF
jgi:hypothetical protein